MVVDLTFEVWQKYFPEKWDGVCLCCGRSIRYPDFHKGHIIADANGGENELSNLVPICMGCNSKMGKEDFFTYRNDHFSDIKINISFEREIELLKLENKILRKQISDMLKLENNDLRKQKDELSKKEKTDVQQNSIIISEKSEDKNEIKEQNTQIKLTIRDIIIQVLKDKGKIPLETAIKQAIKLRIPETTLPNTPEKQWYWYLRYKNKEHKVPVIVTKENNIEYVELKEEDIKSVSPRNYTDEHKILFKKYWDSFKSYSEGKISEKVDIKSTERRYNKIKVYNKNSYFELKTSLTLIRCQFVVYKNKELSNYIISNIKSLEKDVGNNIKIVDTKDEGYIVFELITTKIDLYDESRFEEYHKWYINEINRLLKVISKYIKT